MSVHIRIRTTNQLFKKYLISLKASKQKKKKRKRIQDDTP